MFWVSKVQRSVKPDGREMRAQHWTASISLAWLVHLLSPSYPSWNSQLLMALELLQTLDGLDGLDLKNSSPWATDRHQGVSSSIPPKPCDIFPKKSVTRPPKSIKIHEAQYGPTHDGNLQELVKSSKNSTALPEPRKRHSPRPRHWEVQDQTLHPGTRTKSSDCCWSPWRANAQSMPTKIYKNHQRPDEKTNVK